MFCLLIPCYIYKLKELKNLKIEKLIFITLTLNIFCMIIAIVLFIFIAKHQIFSQECDKNEYKNFDKGPAHDCEL